MAAAISLTLLCLVFIASTYGKAIPQSLLERLLPPDDASVTEILAHVRRGGTIPARLCKQAGILCTQDEESFGPRGVSDKRSFKSHSEVEVKSAGEGHEDVTASYGGNEDSSHEGVTASYGGNEDSNHEGVTASYGGNEDSNHEGVTASYGGNEDSADPWSIVHGRAGVKTGQTTVKAGDQDVSDSWVKEESLFFFRIIALQGKTVSLPPSRSEAPSKFLPPGLVAAFQDMELPQILHTVGLSRHSRLARASRRTWKTCHHESATRGETKSCVASVDQMLDLVNSFLLSDLEVKSLTRSGPYPAPFETLTLVNHTVVSNNRLVTCHTLTFPFAMYVCHGIPHSIAFQVMVQDKAGQQMAVPAVCHMDTSSFNPSHVAFKVLNTTPGNGEVCHWLPENSHIVWYV